MQYSSKQGADFLYCFGSDGSPRWSLGSAEWDLWGNSITVADLDGDGIEEIIVCKAPRDPGTMERIEVLNPAGFIHWSWDTKGVALNTPAIADLDGDGALEIIVAVRHEFPGLPDDVMALDKDGRHFQLTRQRAWRHGADLVLSRSVRPEPSPR